MIYYLDVEIPGNKPALETTEDQHQVIVECLSISNRSAAEKIDRLLRAGKLTTELTIDGDRVSFVLRPVEE